MWSCYDSFLWKIFPNWPPDNENFGRPLLKTYCEKVSKSLDPVQHAFKVKTLCHFSRISVGVPEGSRLPERWQFLYILPSIVRVIRLV
jgi:hypothetical protein